MRVGNPAELREDPLRWVDSDWFQRLWNEVIPKPSPDDPTKISTVTLTEAEALTLPWYNHFVVYKVLRRMKLRMSKEIGYSAEKRMYGMYAYQANIQGTDWTT